MNTLSKITIATAALLSMGALTACQSTANRPDQPTRGSHHHPLTDQEKEQRRANFEQIKQACNGKSVGDSAQVTFNNGKTITGQCELGFRPTPPAGQMAPQNAPMPAPNATGDQPPMPAPNVTGDQPPMPPKDQAMMRHHKHRGDFKVFQHVCDGRTAGQALKVTFKDKTVFGTCEVKFRPDHHHKHFFKHEAPKNAPAVSTAAA
ncbi:hypothetical protein [Acinetobacter sp.]|uniref:hypothetical protein n=1 Tax=Acinetobacter sp. TaxID=472 RepID=UPI0031D027CD